MYGIAVFVFEKRNLERQNREQFVHITLYIFYPPLLPRPYLWRYVIKDRYVRGSVHIPRYAEVEARIVHKNHDIRTPLHYVALAERHVAHDDVQMRDYRNKAHVCQLTVMLHASSAYRRHQIASEEAELGMSVLLPQCSHKS